MRFGLGLGLGFSVGSSASFDPKIAGQGTLILDLDASKITGIAENGPVTTWSDRSGLGNNGTGVNGPTYKAALLGSNLRPAVRFTAGSSQYMLANGVATALSGTAKPFTQILVFKVLAAGAASVILTALGSSASSTQFHWIMNELSHWETDHHNDASTRVTAPRQSSDTDLHILAVMYDGTNTTVQLDGVDYGDGAIADVGGANTWDRFAIAAGILSGAPLAFSQLDLGRLLVYTKVLSAPDLAYNVDNLRAYYASPQVVAPGGLTSLGLWLDASIQTAGALPLWIDRSGHGRNWSEGTNPPTVVAAVQNGLSVVRGDGVNDKLNDAASSARSHFGAAFSLTVVMKAPTGNDAYVFSGLSQIQAIIANFDGPRTKVEWFSGNAGERATFVDPRDAGFHIFTVQHVDGGVFKLYYDGVQVATGTSAATFAGTDIRGLLFAVGGAGFSNANIGEIILNNNATDSLTTLFAELKAKWATP